MDRPQRLEEEDTEFETSYEEWQLVGSTYFSRRELYALTWSRGPRGAPGINIEYMRVFPCSFGGPTALCRDETKVVLQLGSFSRPDIQIFSAAGNPLGRVLWDGGRILAAGWSDTEELIVVDDRGRVQYFTPLGHPSAGRTSFSLGAAAESEGLADIVVSDNCIVARTAACHMWCVPNINEPRTQRYPDPTPLGMGGAVHCLCPIPPQLSASGSLEVLVAVDTTVFIVDCDEASTSAVYEGPIVKFALSPNGGAVAGYAADDVIYIWTSNLEETLVHLAVADTADSMADVLGIDASAVPSGPPDAFVWCGTDGVLALWNGIGVLLVSVESGYQWWDIGSYHAILVSEVDGARIITRDQHLLIRKVPNALASVLEIGSTSPGALLHDARKLYDARDARAAAELLDVLKSGDLPAASAACLGAAAAELDPNKQESLMCAGCYGRAFLALDPEAQAASIATFEMDGLQSPPAGKEVVMLARTLRVLNALREPEVALPLTMTQFNALGLPRLSMKLTVRHQYFLALRICSALGASTEDVLFRWACDKIAASASSATDEELLAVLRAKLEGQSGVKWAAVAAHAQAQGRPRLAAALAQHESCAADQVPLLLSLGEEEAALRRACESGDPDLVFEAAYAMYRRLERQPSSADAQQRFWASMAAHPFAAALISKLMAGGGDSDAAVPLYEAVHDIRAIAVAHVQKATRADAPTAQKAKEWTRAKEAYIRDEKDGKEDAKFESAAAVAALRLAEVQSEIEESTGREGFIGLSVVDTLKQCLRLGLRDQAHKLAKEFKVPEKQQMLLAVGAAAAAHDWAQLQQLASKIDRRAPITMEHIIDASRAHNATVETLKWFIDRISGDNALVRRAQLYAEIGLHREATMLAEQAEMAGAGTGVLNSLRDAVEGTMGSFMGRRTSA